MNGTIDDVYYEWLYSQVVETDRRRQQDTYWSLLRDLYSFKFVWFVPNDDNRVEDGKLLREEFINDTEIDIDVDWLFLDCSILEMLIALARRAAFNSYGEPYDWFWKFLENLGIDHFVDHKYNTATKQNIKRKLRRLNERTYKPNGDGGIFPLVDPEHDQREVELWYQLSAYLLEGEFVDNGPQV